MSAQETIQEADLELEEKGRRRKKTSDLIELKPILQMHKGNNLFH